MGTLSTFFTCSFYITYSWQYDCLSNVVGVFFLFLVSLHSVCFYQSWILICLFVYLEYVMKRKANFQQFCLYTPWVPYFFSFLLVRNYSSDILATSRKKNRSEYDKEESRHREAYLLQNRHRVSRYSRLNNVSVIVWYFYIHQKPINIVYFRIQAGKQKLHAWKSLFFFLTDVNHFLYDEQWRIPCFDIDRRPSDCIKNIRWISGNWFSLVFFLPNQNNKMRE